MTILSVIIPTYNSSLTIEQCLTSLSRQTFQDFEVCLIDGGSSDTTLKKIESFSSNLNLKVISEADEGIYHAMNKGILISSGEWVYFLGSDDRLHSKDVFDRIFNSKSIISNEVIYGNVTSSRFNGIYDGEFNADKLYKKNICHQAIFFKKSIFTKTGNFNKNNKIYADWEHNMKWFYDRSIKKTFIDIIVADFADGGYSSISSDINFQKDKRKIAMTKGFFLFPTHLN